jgi:drug/metabolite transporter (DMT)-like permease
MAIVFWGVSFIATKIALEELLPLQIIFTRLLLGAILLFAIALKGKKDFSLNLKSHGGIFILSLIAVFHLWIQVTGLQYTTAANTGWLIGITPVFMAVMGYLFYKERLNLLNISGILIAFTGLLLLISKGDITNIGFVSNKGDLMVLTSAFTWSVYSAVNKKISISYSPLLTILFLFLMMGIIISPFTLNNDFLERMLNLSGTGWVTILFLGIFCSGLAYVFWSESLKKFDAAKVGAFLYFEPFVAVIAAWIILNEEITLLMMFSGIVITAGVVMVNMKKGKKILF